MPVKFVDVKLTIGNLAYFQNLQSPIDLVIDTLLVVGIRNIQTLADFLETELGIVRPRGYR